MTVLEADERLAQARHEQAAAEEKERLGTVAYRAIDNRGRELDRLIEDSQNEAADSLIEFFGGARKKKPDMAALLNLRSERDPLRIAAARLAVRMPRWRIEHTNARANALFAESHFEEAIAAEEEAAALNALGTVASALGDGAQAQLRNTQFQRRREHADELQILGEKLYREAQDQLQLLEGR